MADSYSFDGEQLADIGKYAIDSMHEHYNDLIPNDVQAVKEELGVMLVFWGRAYEVTGGNPWKLLESWSG